MSEVGTVPKGLIYQNGAMLQPLPPDWAFDLFKHSMWQVETQKMKHEWAIAPFTCSWYHRCMNSNVYSRSDYVKNVNKDVYYIGNIIAHFCWHCKAKMPHKYVRLFQAFFFNERVRHARKGGF